MKKTLCLLLIGLLVSVFATAFSEAENTFLKNPNVENGPEPNQGIVKWSFEVINPERTAKPGEWVQWQYKVTNSPDSTDVLTWDYLVSSIPSGLDPVNPVSWDDADWPPDLEPGQSFEGNHIAWHVDPAAPIGTVIEGELGAGANPPAEPLELRAPVVVKVGEGPGDGMEGTAWDAFIFAFDSETGAYLYWFEDTFEFSGGIFYVSGLGSAPYNAFEIPFGTVWTSKIEIAPDWWNFKGIRPNAKPNIIVGKVDSTVGVYFRFFGKQISSGAEGKSATPDDWGGK